MDKPLDSELEGIVAALRSQGITAAFSEPLSRVRARFETSVMAARAAHPIIEVGHVYDTLAEHADSKVPVRIYRPAGGKPSPTLAFFHGGGFMLGSVDLMDNISRKLCRDIGAVIVSVEYRLAPEHRFPAAHDDALAATWWMAEHSEAIGGNGLVGVVGESAGANLAASAAILLRDRGIPLAAQLLVSPGLDFARDITAIVAPPSDFPMLTCSDLETITERYLNGARPRAFPPSPMHAHDLSGLPPTIIAVAGHDPLQSEGIAYAGRLKSAGTQTIVRRFPDLFHPFLGFFEFSRAAEAATDLLCSDMREVLSRSNGL